MPQPDWTFIDLVLLWSHVGAAVVAALVLSLELLARPALARYAPGVCALVFAALAALAAWLAYPSYVVTGSAALAAVLLLIWPLNFPAARQWISRLLTPRVVWGLLLVTSLLVSRSVASHLANSLDRKDLDVIECETVQVANAAALTDKRSMIPLYHFQMYTDASVVQQVVQQNEAAQGQVVRVQDTDLACNCHGWIFTEGKYAIQGADVPRIIADNGYQETQQPRPGDLAVYDQGDRVTHTGVVRLIAPKGMILVESKWGPLGVYLHPVERQPFGGTCRFYRSPRHGHVLSFVPDPSPKPVGSNYVGLPQPPGSL